MKRLLAYLFIVLGLGLTFNINANAETTRYSYDKEFICIQDLNGTIFAGSSLSGWVTTTDNIENLCDYYIYKEYHKKIYDKISKKCIARGGITYDQCGLKSSKKSLPSYRFVKLVRKLNKEKYSKVLHNKIVLEKNVKKEVHWIQKKSQEMQNAAKLEKEKKKKEEQKEQKRIAEAKKKEQEEQEEQKRIAEAKKKEKEEQKYKILVKKYGDNCKDNSLGSPEFNKCLKDAETEDLLQAKLQREFLASLTPEEARAYTCNNTFGFKKGSSNFKDCIFKLYTTELELEKLDLEKQLALAKVEAEKAKADTARAQVEIIQAKSAAAKAEGKLQEAQIQATKAQTLIMQQQAAAAKQQAAAAQAQAKAVQQQNSINLMTQGLKMLSGNQSSTRLRTNCSWSSIGISCR